MTMLKFEVERARVEEIVFRLEEEFDLKWLTISHLFSENLREDAVIAETEGDWEYRSACITWNLPSVARITDRTLEDVAVHEFIHCVLAPVEENLPKKDHVDKLREFAVESLTRMIQASRYTRQSSTG